MALFKKAQSEDNYIEFVEDILIKTPTNGSVVSKCMVVNGDIKSCEPIIIEGKVEGNIKCEDIVVVLSGGFVAGKIEAKEVRLDGQIEGPIEANIVEQLKDAKQEGYILANVAILNGVVDGDIVCKESLEIGADAKIEWANPTVRDGGFSAETLWVANGTKWVEVGWTKEDPPGAPPMGTYLYYAWNDGTYHQYFLESTGSHNTYKIEHYSGNSWRIYINGALRATVSAGFSTANRIDCGGEVTGNTNAMGISGTLNLRYKTTDQRWLYWWPTTLYWDSPYWVVKIGGSNSNLQNGGNNP